MVVNKILKQGRNTFSGNTDNVSRLWDSQESKIFQTCSTQSIPLIVYTIGAQLHNVKCAYLGTFLTTKQGSMSGALLMNQLLTKTIKLSV